MVSQAQLPIHRRMARAFRLLYAALTDSSNLSDPRQWLIEWSRGGLASDAGVVVNDQTSMSIAAVWYAVNRIAGDVGQLPLIEYKRTTGESRANRERAKEEAAYLLMKKAPNAEMSAGVFRETLMAHALLRGNGYAYIDRQPASGRILQLIPLPIGGTFPFRLYDEGGEDWQGTLWYKTTFRTTTGATITRVFRPDQVFHLRGLGWDGLQGQSVVSLARQSFGLAIAAEKHGARFFRNSARPGLILEAPPGAFRSEEEARQFLKDWDSFHSGLDNASKSGMLREGVKANVVSMSNEDSQWLESRKFQRVEVALWFGLEYITGDDSSVSYNSLEQKALAYLQSTLQRWLVRWQEECDAKLLTERQKKEDSHYFEFLLAAMLRGSLLDRYRAYEIGRRNEWLSADDVREMENLNERPDGGGNEYANPNVKSIGKAPVEDSVALIEPSFAGHLSVRGLVRSRLEWLYAEERRKVLNAASRSKAFLAWANRFYETWGETINTVFSEMGAPPGLAESEMRRSQTDLLEAVSRAKRGELQAAIKLATAAWEDRAAKVTDQILRHAAQRAA